MNSLQLISSKKELLSVFIFVTLIFLFNIIHEYFKYKDFTDEEVFSGNFQVVNIYDKNDYYVVKLKNENVAFFTSINKEQSLKKLEYLNIAIITVKVDFISYLKGFYAKSIYYDILPSKNYFKKSLFNKINEQHEEPRLKQLFSALFLAIPISKEYREIYTNFGISHLIAISGFHLGILSALVYWFIYFPYSYVHQRYLPFRNKKFDILVVTLLILLFYVILTDIVPSLLRAFVMFFIGIYFLRSNIKILSFQTLLITLLVIVSLYPKYLFSISLWFSMFGVFYIFLYLQYFKDLPKLFSFFLFNFWIFFVFNPIVHFFFLNTSYEQLISPFITVIFTIFYPLELFLHFIGYESLLDEYLLQFLDYKMSIYDVSTPLYFFILYVLTSLYAIFNKTAFIILNILLVIFNIYLYYGFR
ncbi:MAG: competence protein [Arcobacter sp.]|nr:MAG: competence protein [Arcobacter sp.]